MKKQPYPSPGGLNRRGQPARFHHIANKLREDIKQGLMPPGTKLPNRVELVRRYRSSSHTVQRAFNLLLEEGILRACIQGTFVAEAGVSSLPYVLVMLRTTPQNHLQNVLEQEAKRLDRQGWPFLVTWIDQHGFHSPEYKELNRLVHSHRLAGLILVNASSICIPSPMVEEPHIPRVWVEGPRASTGCHVSFSGNLLDVAIHECVAHGHRRIAAIHPVQFDVEIQRDYEKFATLLASHGLEPMPNRWMPVNLNTPETASFCSRSLMLLPRSMRPDVLIIEDDNLVPAATRGLRDSDPAQRKRLDVIAHTNFPCPTEAVVPVRRIGYDIRELLERCRAAIDDQRDGKKIADQTIDLIWEPLR